jgi:hypothetical protein
MRLAPRVRSIRWPFFAVIVLVVAACDGSAIPDSAMSLSIANGTTLGVTVVVNGTTIETVAAGQGDEIPASRLPSLPWRAEVRSPSGRQLQQLTVNSGDVHRTMDSTSGDAVRIDLSCGRLDLWSAPPLVGPAPGPGTPGDCAP